MDLLNIIRENTSQQAWNWYEKSIKENREAFEEKNSSKIFPLFLGNWETAL